MARTSVRGNRRGLALNGDAKAGAVVAGGCGGGYREEDRAFAVGGWCQLGGARKFSSKYDCDYLEVCGRQSVFLLAASWSRDSRIEPGGKHTAWISRSRCAAGSGKAF